MSVRRIIDGAVRRLYLGVRYNIGPRIGHAIMSRRSQNQIVARWPETGEIPVGPRVCVFVHWDGGGEVRDHVLNQLRALAAAGLSVLFVTNSGFLRPASLEALKAVCAGVLIRRNIGYDFGASREGLEQLALPRADTTMVVIANDSVYGPLRPLHELLGRIDFAAADVWGATESWQSRYHLQSYFMAFSPRVVASDPWRQFWAEVRPTWSKMWLIRIYEIGLSQALLKGGFECRALWPYDALVGAVDLTLLNEKRIDEEAGPDLADPMVQNRRRHALRLREAVANRIPLNPTSDLWRELLLTGYPFLKRELLRDNPSFVADVGEWRAVVAASGAKADLAAIERDLRRTAKNRAP